LALGNHHAALRDFTAAAAAASGNWQTYPERIQPEPPLRPAGGQGRAADAGGPGVGAGSPRLADRKSLHDRDPGPSAGCARCCVAWDEGLA
jgi:hypothetical protein